MKGEISVLGTLTRSALAATASILLLAGCILGQAPVEMGTSASVAADPTSPACCPFTAGSLVLLDGSPAILTSIPPLTRSRAQVVDPSCSRNAVASNNTVIPNSPAGLAALTPLPGKVDLSGRIQGIGVPCESTATPAVGMPVTKSGGATGVTTGTVEAVNVSAILVFAQCSGTTRFNESFTNLLLIAPGTFATSADSGSLVLTSSTHHPVGLVVGANSQGVLALGIESVATAFTSQGHSFAFVGSSCPLKEAELAGAPPVAVEQARAVKAAHEAELLAMDGVFAVGVGRSGDEEESTEPAIVVYVAASPQVPLGLPRELDGIKLRIIASEPFIAR